MLKFEKKKKIRRQKVNKATFFLQVFCGLSSDLQAYAGKRLQGYKTLVHLVLLSWTFSNNEWMKGEIFMIGDPCIIRIYTIMLPTKAHKCIEMIFYTHWTTMGRDSSVGIATRYGLDGPGIESRWGRDFPNPSRPVLGPTQPPVQWVPGLSLE